MQKPQLCRDLNITQWYGAVQDSLRMNLRVFEILKRGDFRFSVIRTGCVFYRCIDVFDYTKCKYINIVYSRL